MIHIRPWSVGLVTVVMAFAIIVGAQQRLDGLRTRAFDDELLYLPSEKILDHLTAGMDSLIADVLWIKCLHYTAKHFKGDGKFVWLNHMFNLITTLDPYFVAPYRYGGIFLATLKADDDASIKLLEKGMVRNPDAWVLPYEIAMTWLLNRRDRPESPLQAARYLALAVETGKAPPFVADLAQGLQAAHNLNDIERAMWENSRNAGDPLLRDLADRKLTELDIRETCAELDKAVAVHASRFGAPPKQLSDLVSGNTIRELPDDPLGGTYFLDAAGKVNNTTLLDGQASRDLSGLRNAIGLFKKDRGCWPATLEELVDAHVLGEVPPHPYAGHTWQYNPASGDVS